MKRNSFILFGSLLVLLAGCSFFPAVEGSGFPTSCSYGLQGFSRIQASQAFKVHIVPDAVFSVTITCDDNIPPYLAVDTVNDTLRLDLQREYTYGPLILSAEVHMPTVTNLDFSGAAQAKIDAGFSSSLPLGVTLSGASSIECRSISCGTVTAAISGASSLSILDITAGLFGANVSGGSSLTVKGVLTRENLAVSGGSKAHLADCPAGQATLTLSGGSEGWLNVGTGQITLSASGYSTLYYRGSPVFSINELSGSAKIVRIF